MLQRTQDDDLVMSLVEMALARLPDEREAYLQNACAADAELFREVWNYVKSTERMDRFLLDPVLRPDLFEYPFEPGDLLDGRFRIVSELGQGGMGVECEACDEKLTWR